jgi:hypothetical protein
VDAGRNKMQEHKTTRMHKSGNPRQAAPCSVVYILSVSKAGVRGLLAAKASLLAQAKSSAFIRTLSWASGKVRRWERVVNSQIGL